MRYHVLAFIPAISGCEAPEASADPDGLGVTLTEVSASAIPSDWTVLELASDDGAHQALYLKDPSRLVWLPDTIDQVALPYRRVIGMRAVDEGTVEAVDAALKEIVTLAKAEGVTARWTVPTAPDSKIWDARWIDGTWYLSVGDSTAAPHILALSRHDGLRMIGDPIQELETRATLLGAIGRDLVVSEITAPFRVGRLIDGRWHLSAPTASRDLSSPKSMVALPVLPLGDRGIQTVIDVTSAKRVLRVLGAGPGSARRHDVDVPLAVVGTTSGDLLLALRQTDIQEIVAYSWEWR